jgi:hypothetical protein
MCGPTSARGRPLRISGVLAAVGAALVLASCGSAHGASKSEAIHAGLLRLQSELEQQRRKVAHGENVLGTLILVHAAPPEGVGVREWTEAVRRDVAVQRLLRGR